MKLKYLFYILSLSLSGCLDDPIVDISRLSKHDRFLFAAAAAIEGVDVTTESRPWYWIVKYHNFPPHGTRGDYRCRNDGLLGYEPIRTCVIKISYDLIPCEVGGRDQRFFITSRHEIREAKGRPHVNDPNQLMFYSSPCWPID